MKNLLKPLIVTMCRISILLQLMGIVQENGKNGKFQQKLNYYFIDDPAVHYFLQNIRERAEK